MNQIKKVVAEYNRHASTTVPSILCTVAIWSGAQTLINEFLRVYAPTFPMWQVGLFEIFIASFALWVVTLKKEEAHFEPDQPEQEKTPEVIECNKYTYQE